MLWVLLLLIIVWLQDNQNKVFVSHNHRHLLRNLLKVSVKHLPQVQKIIVWLLEHYKQPHNKVRLVFACHNQQILQCCHKQHQCLHRQVKSQVLLEQVWHKQVRMLKHNQNLRYHRAHLLLQPQSVK